MEFLHLVLIKTETNTLIIGLLIELSLCLLFSLSLTLLLGLVNLDNFFLLNRSCNWSFLNRNNRHLGLFGFRHDRLGLVMASSFLSDLLVELLLEKLEKTLLFLLFGLELLPLKHFSSVLRFHCVLGSKGLHFLGVRDAFGNLLFCS